MIIECPRCEARVDAKKIAEKDFRREDEDPYTIFFLECPVCGDTMLGQSGYVQVDVDDWDHENPTRLWPDPVEQLHYSIPSEARLSIDEATKCFKAQAYLACAVMCGRAIEAICVEHETKSKNLAAGLKELRDRQVIDQRLFDWGEALREKRNIGAHATGESIARVDAKDVLEFAIAICEYVFVLTEKYEAFKKRQAKRDAMKAGLKAF